MMVEACPQVLERIIQKSEYANCYSEIKSIFSHVNGVHAKRNETLLIVGIGMALRDFELIGLKVKDVYDRQYHYDYPSRNREVWQKMDYPWLEMSPTQSKGE